MQTSRDKESGYALLLVFLMAAIIAISLYSEIPRVAFQAQRQKEQLLMERGEQYRRAVEVFFQSTNGQFPRSLDDLEKYQNRRFLRHKYIDPMTGKSEWRIIHVGPGGIPTDSIIVQRRNQQTESGDSSYIIDSGVVNMPSTGQQQAARPQDRRRASEGGPGGENALSAGNENASPAEDNPEGGATAQGTQAPAANAQAQPAAVVAGGRGQTAQVNPTANTNQQAGAGAYITPLPAIGSQLPAPTQGAAPALGAQGQNPATQIIQNLLTQPNSQGARIVAQQGMMGSGMGSSGSGSMGSGGLGGISGSQISTPGMASGSGSAGSGGVGGVASTSELDGIMVYNDATTYNKWEFVFNPATLVQIPMLGGSAQSGSSMDSFTSRTSTAAPARSATPSQSGAGMSSQGGRGGAGAPGAAAGQSGAGVVSQLPSVRMGRP